MLPHTESPSNTAGGGGMIDVLARFVVRKPIVVIVFWIALAAVLSQSFPTLTQLVRERPIELLPADSPVATATRDMTEAFDESGLENILLIVLTDENGLNAEDEATYANLVTELRQNIIDVVMIQDFVTTPPLRETFTSKDGKAWYLPIGLAGELGSPQAYEAYTRVADTVRSTIEASGADGSGLTANLTGPAATVADASDVGERALHLVEIATVAMVLLILLVVYRNIATMLLPLLMIGMALVVSQGIVAGLTQAGMGISNQTIAFMSALIAGAGTDYAVFLISRYHEYLRLGYASDEAVIRAMTSIGKVIAASAGTVAITFLGMVFTKLGLFSTIGPALAISVAVAFLAAMTFLPAILVLAGRRGWVAPRRDISKRFWRRSAIHIVRRPKTHLLASLLVLAILAGCTALAQYNWDDRKTLPASTESNQGYAAMDRHFQLNSTLPQYILIQSPHDLRTPAALADLEQMAERISQLPGIAAVRGITRPTGESLEQARLSFQAGEVGNKLGEAATLINDRGGDLDLLTTGANALADTLTKLSTGLNQSIGDVRTVVDALEYLEEQFGGSATLAEIDNATGLAASLRELGDAIGVNIADTADDLAWIGPVLNALNTSAVCNADPSCRTSRDQLSRLVTARDNGLLDKIAALAREMQSTQDAQTLQTTVTKLGAALDTVSEAVESSGLNSAGDVQAQLTTLQDNAALLAEGSRKLAEGVQLLVDQVRQLGGGLGDASGLLLQMKYNATEPSMAGFYIPEQLLSLDEFKKAASIFVSPDGHSVRYLVQTNLNPFSTEAMDQVNLIGETAQQALPNTTLSDATVSVAGFSATLRDIRDYYNHDLRLIMILTIMVVLVILIALLRALVAPLYLVGSVVISYMSALGIGIIVFQLILDQPLHWSVPGLAFIVLVAVGADYNMLLISRLREESFYGVPSGVIRTVGSTGGVITSAGVIFAASMVGLMFGGVTTMIQAGFIMAAGLLLDTFIVRTITVPALAVLIGKANWWPSKWVPKQPTGRALRPGAERSEQLTLF